MKSYFVYILASKTYGTLYIGVTNGLIERVDQHRTGIGDHCKDKVHGLSGTRPVTS